MNTPHSTNPDCRAVRQALEDRFGAAVPPALAGERERHLAGCAECRAYRASLQRLQEGLRTLPAPDPGPRYWANVLPAVRSRLDRRRETGAGRRVWIPAAAVAIVAGLLLWATPQRLSQPGLEAGGVEQYGYLDLPDYNRLARVGGAEVLMDSLLEPAEREFVMGLSGVLDLSTDPVDRLSEMDEQAVETILQKLKEQSVIQS
ncbi:MAG: hypothetical protein C4524_12575 [Candidatus Zixiibacteriota bacterium]|nr:MAG: hypothetical protein C4524_12575 [candidate division Zixibacteria bacterium]